MHFRRIALLLACSSLLLASPALGQVPGPAIAEPPPAAAADQPPAGLWLTTPAPDFSTVLEETVTIPLSLRNSGLPPQRASLDLTGLPEGWGWSIRADNRAIGAAIVLPDDSQSLTLELTPPPDAAPEALDIAVVADTGETAVSLPLTIRFDADEPGGVTLEPELPALRGAPNSTFTYRLTLRNDSAQEGLFNLAAQTPPGFTTTFKRGYGSEQITGVPVEAGASETVTLEVKPGASVPAGRYPIAVEVLSGELSATAELSAELTGAPDLQLVGPNERLSGTATAGAATTFPFTIGNAGTADAEAVAFSASAPTGWTVAFAPEELPALAAGAVQQVDVAITPSEQAVAGDYMVTVRANGSGVSESVQFRVTVQTSTVWGLVGLGVIAVAVIVLVLAVLRYGRR